MKSSSYAPALDYLRNIAKLNAFLVANGEDLPSRLLFDIHFHTLKSDIRLRSSELRLTADEPKLRFRIKGRTDIVILPYSSIVPNRLETMIAIEIKPVGFNVKEALHEAFIQLVGLTSNDTSSPCVIVTNFAKKHFVLYLEAIDHIKMKFMIVVKRFDMFNECLWFSMLLPERECKTKHLGECATPPQSASSDEASESSFHGFDSSFQT